MSAAAAESEPIRSAVDLDLPANLASLGEGLPLKTVAQLARELLDAIDEAKRTNDFTELQATLRRWQAIRKMMTDPRWPRVVKQVESGAWRRATPMTIEEFRARFPRPA